MAFLWIPPDLIFDEERKIKASPDGASGLRDSLEIDQYTELVSLKWTNTAVSQVTLSLLSLFQMLLANGFQTCTLGSPGGTGVGREHTCFNKPGCKASHSTRWEEYLCHLHGYTFQQVKEGGGSPMSGTEQCNGIQCSSHLVLFL